MDLTSLEHQAILLIKIHGVDPMIKHWNKETFTSLTAAKHRGLQESWLLHIGATEGQEAHVEWGDPRDPEAEEWVPVEQLATRLQARCAATGVTLHTTETHGNVSSSPRRRALCQLSISKFAFTFTPCRRRVHALRGCCHDLHCAYVTHCHYINPARWLQRGPRNQ